MIFLFTRQYRDSFASASNFSPMYYLIGILEAMYISGEYLSGVSFCQGNLFVGEKFQHQAKISSRYLDEFFFEEKILKIEIYICLRFAGKINRRGKLFMREDFVGEYYSRGKISWGNIIHGGRFRRGILFMWEDFVGEYYS